MHFTSNLINRILHHHKRRKLMYLFVSLVFLLMGYPFFEHGVFKSPVMVIFLTSVLSTAMYSLTDENNLFYIGLLLGVPAVIFSWLNVIDMTTLTVLGSHLFTIFLYIFTSVAIIDHIFKDHDIGSDAIFGAISVYLILGILWATLFSLLYYFDPSSLLIVPLDGFHGSANLVWSDFIYFSYSNLTSLGLGDINPTTPLVKSLVVLEAMAGVIYMAVLVSRFIRYSDRR